MGWHFRNCFIYLIIKIIAFIFVFLLLLFNFSKLSLGLISCVWNVFWFMEVKHTSFWQSSLYCICVLYKYKYIPVDQSTGTYECCATNTPLYLGTTGQVIGTTSSRPVVVACSVCLWCNTSTEYWRLLPPGV